MSSPSYFALLRDNPPFRHLWLGQLISFFGDWFKTIALFTIVHEWTDNALALSAVMVAKMLPIFLVMPVAGVLADRFDRRTLMLATDFFRFFGSFGLIYAYRSHNMVLLFAIVIAMVSASGIFIPTRTAVLPQLTCDEELPVAIALSSGTWSIMLAVGAAAGGFVTQAFGVEFALFLDGLTFLISAFFLVALPSLPPGERSEEGGSFVDALRYLKKKTELAWIISLKVGLSFCDGVLVCLPLLGEGYFPGNTGPFYVGMLYACRGLGALGGSMVFRRWTGDSERALRKWITPGFLLGGAAYAMLAFAPHFGWAALGYFVGAFGGAIVWTYGSVLGQRASDTAMKGRVFALEFGLFTLSSSIVSAFSGLLLDQFALSIPTVVFGSGCVMLLPASAWYVFGVRPHRVGVA